MNSARRRAAARPLEEPEVRNPQALEPRRRQSLEGRTKVDGKSWGGRELRWTWIAGGRSTGRSLRSARGFHGNKVSSFRLNLPPTCWWGNPSKQLIALIDLSWEDNIDMQDGGGDLYGGMV